MIQINKLSKRFGPQELFDELSLLVGSRERVGLVGRNGSGKSTLFKIILGQLPADSGEIAIPKNYTLASLGQHIEFTENEVLKEVIQCLPEEESYDFYKAEKILFGLGFSEADMSKNPEDFSGGYQVRINLAKALVANPNLLLLDEPTNYLDIVSLRWLRDFLKSFSGEVLLITHDRDFMDSVVTHVGGLSRGKLKKIKGNTLKYYEQIIQEDEMYEKTRLNQDKKKKELESFINRFKAKASKAAQAQSRVKQLEKMGSMDKLGQDANLGFRFVHKECPGKVIMSAENLSFSYDGASENFLFSNLNFTIGRHDRIGIIGKNGKGKSTLLNVLGGNLKPVTGSVSQHPKAQVGHFGQTNINHLHLSNTVAQEIAAENEGLGHTAIRGICGAMMFEGGLADKKISVLSGGERSRVMLGKIIAHPTNLLMLDEPTNHLDMESIESLAEEVAAYAGAVVLVTHSEMLLRLIVNKLIIFHEGKAELFLGTYDDFLEKIGWESEIAGNKKEKNKLSNKERNRLKQEATADKVKRSAPLKEEMEKIEEEISSLESLVSKYQDLITEKSAKGEDPLELYELVGKLHHKIEDKFSHLEKISDEYEKIKKN